MSDSASGVLFGMEVDGAAAGVTDGAAGVERICATVSASFSGSATAVFLTVFLEMADFGAMDTG